MSCSGERLFLKITVPKSCQVKLPGKIIEKIPMKKKFLVKLQASSLQLY